MAVDADGDFVVVWESYGSSGTDTSGFSVQGQRYASGGSTQGAEFQVNTYTTGFQRHPSVAADADGDFVVVWQSDGSYGTYTMAPSIQGQRYDSGGSTQGPEFQVTPIRRTVRNSPPWRRMRKGTSSWCGTALAGPGRARATTASGAGATPRTDRRRTLSSRSTATRPASNIPPPWRKPTATSSWCGEATGPPGRTPTTRPANATAWLPPCRPCRPATRPRSAAALLLLGAACALRGRAYASASPSRIREPGRLVGRRLAVPSRPPATPRPGVRPLYFSTTRDEECWRLFGGSPRAIRWSAAMQKQRVRWAVGFCRDRLWLPGFSRRVRRRSFRRARSSRSTPTRRSTRSYPSVAAEADGDFVVVWSCDGSSGTNTSAYSIQGQRYASDGSAQGAQFQVNTYTTGNQRNPSVAADADGDFIVVWESHGSYGTDTRDKASRASARPRTDRPRARSSRSTPTRRTPSFTPPWRRMRTGTSSWCGRATARPGRTPATKHPGQRYASDGSPQGAEFQVNTYTTSSRASPSVAADADGDFVVVWQSYGSSGTDTSGYSVQGQRYASDGSPQGAQFQVNTYTTGYQLIPPWRRTPTGTSSWCGGATARRDGHERLQHPGPALRLGRFDSGRGVPGQLLYDERPGISLRDGGCGRELRRGVGQRGSYGTDTSGDSIQGQRYASDGATQGAQFQVNTYTTSQQCTPPWRRPTATSSWCGEATGPRTTSTRASWASASAWPPPCRRCRPRRDSRSLRRCS